VSQRARSFDHYERPPFGALRRAIDGKPIATIQSKTPDSLVFQRVLWLSEQILRWHCLRGISIVVAVRRPEYVRSLDSTSQWLNASRFNEPFKK